MTYLSGTCIACGTTDVRPILTIDRAPVLCNELCHTRDEALAAQVAPIDLAYCRSCGHVFNATFEASRIVYGPDYENSLHFSPRFRAYSAALVDALSKRHELTGRAVVEVGCGNGDFLTELCTGTGGLGHGFDPSYDGPSSGPGGVQFSSTSFFDADEIPRLGLICCRHVLEHVEQPRGFVAAIAGKLQSGSGPSLYMEVPNALYTLRDLGIWDIIYEHPSYFCAESLSQVVDSAGFGRIKVEETFGGQFLGLHARLEGESVEPTATGSLLGDTAELVDRFADAYETKVRAWSTTLAEATAAGRRIAVWGAGSKGASFLNVLAAGPVVEFVVDVNPKKQGNFIAGTGHRIVGPDALREAPVETVILMNPLYEAEVRASLDAVCPGAELLLA